MSEFASTRFWAGMIAAGLTMGMAGCQSSGGAGTPDAGAANGATGQKVSEADLNAYCPAIQLREGTAYFTTYKSGAEKTPENVIYQASITDVTRTCRFNADRSAVMTVAVAGKIVPGPAGRTGTITMPIRIALMRSDKVVNSSLDKFKVNVSETAGATQFVYDDRDVAVAAPVDGSLQVFVGYDEGPDKTP